MTRLRGIRRHLSFANVASLSALVFAMGGSAYALSIPRNSVGSAQIKKNGVRNSDIRKGAVTATKVKNRSLKSVDFALGQLPAGPRGLQGVQGPKGTFGAITVRRSIDFTVPDDGSPTGLQVECLAGTRIIGGGAFLDSVAASNGVTLIASRPFNTASGVGHAEPPVNGDTFNAWRVVYANPAPGGAATGHAYAICAQT